MIFEGDAERAKAARASTLEGSPERIDESFQRVQSETLRKLRDMPGNVGAIGYADRKSGRVTLISLWESPDAMRQSEQQATRIREEAAERGKQRIARVDRYEVAVAQQLSGVRV
jgi:heme-degrading monooxygenase HmoA